MRAHAANKSDNNNKSRRAGPTLGKTLGERHIVKWIKCIVSTKKRMKCGARALNQPEFQEEANITTCRRRTIWWIELRRTWHCGHVLRCLSPCLLWNETVRNRIVCVAIWMQVAQWPAVGRRQLSNGHFNQFKLQELLTDNKLMMKSLFDATHPSVLPPHTRTLDSNWSDRLAYAGSARAERHSNCIELRMKIQGIETWNDKKTASISGIISIESFLGAGCATFSRVALATSPINWSYFAFGCRPWTHINCSTIATLVNPTNGRVRGLKNHASECV